MPRGLVRRSSLKTWTDCRVAQEQSTEPDSDKGRRTTCPRQASTERTQRSNTACRKSFCSCDQDASVCIYQKPLEPRQALATSILFMMTWGDVRARGRKCAHKSDVVHTHVMRRKHDCERADVLPSRTPRWKEDQRRAHKSGRHHPPPWASTACAPRPKSSEHARARDAGRRPTMAAHKSAACSSTPRSGGRRHFQNCAVSLARNMFLLYRPAPGRVKHCTL